MSVSEARVPRNLLSSNPCKIWPSRSWDDFTVYLHLMGKNVCLNFFRITILSSSVCHPFSLLSTLTFLGTSLLSNSPFYLVMLGFRYIFLKTIFLFKIIFFIPVHLIKGNLHVRSGAMEKNLGDLVIFSSCFREEACRMSWSSDYIQGENKRWLRPFRKPGVYGGEESKF